MLGVQAITCGDAEVMVAGKKAGLDLQRLLEVLNTHREAIDANLALSRARSTRKPVSSVSWRMAEGTSRGEGPPSTMAGR